MKIDNISDLTQEVREVNLSYLLLSQRLLREDFAAGMFRTGLDAEAGQILVGLSPAQLIALSSSSNLLVGFRLNDASLLTMLADTESGGLLQRARAVMALAQSEPMRLQSVEQ